MDQDATSEKDAGRAQEPVGAEGHAEEKPHKEYEIDIFRDWCKSCGICAAFCPQKCISLDADGAPVVEASEKCTGCRWCELHCPDFAICVKELISPKAEGGKED